MSSEEGETLENVILEKQTPESPRVPAITENMDWGQHISDISSKATKTLGGSFLIILTNLLFLMGGGGGGSGIHYLLKI